MNEHEGRLRQAQEEVKRWEEEVRNLRQQLPSAERRLRFARERLRLAELENQPGKPVPENLEASPDLANRVGNLEKKLDVLLHELEGLRKGLKGPVPSQVR